MKRLLGLLMAVMVMMGGMASSAETAQQEARKELLFKHQPDQIGIVRRFPMVDCLLNHLWRTQKRRHTTTLSCLLKTAVCFAHQQVDLRTWQNRQPIGKPF